MHIGLNAHLLAAGGGYRAAGIHRYIDHLLQTLPGALPADWHLTAMVGAANRQTYPGITMRRAFFDTQPPLRRIIWEQLVQPWQLPAFDLHHALAFVAPLVLPTPTVVTLYDLSFIHYPDRLSRLRREYLSRFARLTCERARRIIAISEYTARDLSTTFGITPERIDIAPPGCNHDRFRPLDPDAVTAFRRDHALPERFWLFVGTLEPRKNLVTLLEAYSTLPRAARLPLIIAGDQGWDYAPIFEAVERLRLTSDVSFPGYISAEMLPLWYNAAHAFVYPSVFEGFGMPVIEALACGTPVVVSNASSLPEAAGDAGLQVAPQGVDGWAAALRQCMDDEDWRPQARARGLAHAARFTWQAAAETTALSYRRALGLETR